MEVDSQPHLLEVAAALKEITARIPLAVGFEEALDDLVTVSSSLLGPQVHCAVTLISQGEPAVYASSGLPVDILDEVRHCDGDGPCMQAIRTRDIVISRDLSQETRWPRWSALAAGSGIGAVMSYPFDVDGPMLAALNLFGADGESLDGDIPVIAMLLADQAGLLLRLRLRQHSQDDLIAQVSTVVDGDTSIDRAVGIVMAQRGCPPDQALRHLHEAATNLGVGLGTVAARLVRTVADRASPTT